MKLKNGPKSWVLKVSECLNIFIDKEPDSDKWNFQGRIRNWGSAYDQKPHYLFTVNVHIKHYTKHKAS